MKKNPETKVKNVPGFMMKILRTIPDKQFQSKIHVSVIDIKDNYNHGTGIGALFPLM